MKQYFEIAYIAFETIAILVLILGAVIAMGRFIKGMLRGSERHQAYRDFRQSFGRTLLLALDLLVAADIILTVTLDLAF
mgnify:FL=1